jgi:hypothetical protein
MDEIQRPTDVEIRMYALNLAARQACEALDFKDGMDMASETLAMGRRYRDWLVNGDAIDAVPEPGEDEPGYNEPADPNDVNLGETRRVRSNQ